jgi:hypothetical protein
MGAIFDPILRKLRSDEATGGDAEDVAYDNTASGLTADDVQDAIDEIAALSGSKADLEFVDGDLGEGDILAVPGQDPIAAVLDADGNVQGLVPIMYGSPITQVDLSAFAPLTGTWRIKFAVGAQGPQGEPGTGGMENPMTAAGDMIVGGVDGAPARLAKGAALQVLRMNADATAQEYADPTGGGGGMAANRLTAKILYGGI